jgi:MFS family permease
VKFHEEHPMKNIPGLNRQSMLFLVHSAIYHIGFFGISDVLLNFYFVSLGYDTDTVGFLQGLSRLGGFVTGIPIGLLAERIGAKRISMLGMAGVVIGYALMLSFPSLFMLAAARFVIGVAFNAAFITASPLLMQLTEKRYHTYLFSHYNIVTMGATSLGSVIGGYLPTTLASLLHLPGEYAISVIGGYLPTNLTTMFGLPWQHAPSSTQAYAISLAVAATIIGLSIFPMASLRDPGDARRSAAKRGDTPPTERIPWGYVTLLSLPYLVFGVTAGLTFPFYNLFFRTTFSIPDQTVGTILSVGWLCMGLFTVINPWLERRFGLTNGLALMMGVASVAFIVLGTTSSLVIGTMAFAAAVATRNTMGTLFPPLMMGRLDIAHHNASNGLATVLWSLGWFGATIVGGFLQRSIGYGAIMIIVAFGLFLTAACTVLIFRRPARPIHAVSSDVA